MSKASWHKRARRLISQLEPNMRTRRWIELSIMAVISALIVRVSLYHFAGLIIKFHHVPMTIFVSGVLSIALTSCWLGWGRWKPIFGYRTFFQYPPTWLSVSIGLLLVSMTSSGSEVLISAYQKTKLDDIYNPFSFAQFNWTVIGVSIGIAGVSHYLPIGWNGRPDWEGNLPTGLTVNELDTWRLPDPPTWEGWGEWLNNDCPVKDPDSDIFRHQHIAQRIVRRLLSSQKPPPQAVIGDLGSGKSSVGYLVKWELDHQKVNTKIKFIVVGIWEYENARAAVHGLVKELVDTLEREVVAFGVTELPGQYVEAMTAAGGGWSAVSRLLGWSARPLDALKQIDEIASILNVRFVLWIEDLERYAGLAGKRSGELSSAEFERVGPIRALIDSLNKLQSVSMILATTKPSDQMDLEKLALYVEEIPKLDPRKVRTVLGAFRRAAFSKDPSLIDPSAGDGRQDLDMLDQESTALFADQLSEGHFYYMSQALPFLCRNPRVLKQSLRKCFEFWDTNPGEIDFDALMVGSILFYFDREAFEFMRQNAKFWIGKTQDAFFLPKHEDPSNKFLKERGYDDIYVEAIKRAFIFLLATERSKTRLQGFSESHGTTKYWERFLASPHIPKPDSDQTLLAMMEEQDIDKLLLALEGKQSSSVEHFSKRLDHEVVQQLLISLVDRHKGEHISNWIKGEGIGREDHAPGLIPVWRIWLTRRHYPEFMKNAIAKLKQAMEIAIPENLALAFDLEYFFVVADSSYGNNFLEGDTEKQIFELKMFFRDQMFQVYHKNPDLLLARLEGVPDQYLWWLCWGLDKVRNRQFEGLPFPNWPSFKEILLANLEKSPELMAPQVVRLLLNYTSTFGGERYSYNHDLDKRLFGGVARNKILELVPKDSPLRDTPLIKALIEFSPKKQRKPLTQLLEPQSPAITQQSPGRRKRRKDNVQHHRDKQQSEGND